MAIIIHFLPLLLLLIPGSHLSTTELNETLSFVPSKNTTYYELRAKNILERADHFMQDIYLRKRNLFLSWTKGRGYNALNHGPTKQKIDADYRHLVYELAGNLSVIPVKYFSDPILQRQVQSLSKLQVFGLNDEDFMLANELLHQIHSFLTKRVVCAYKVQESCKNYLGMVTSIINHVSKSQKLEEINYYWGKWRENLNERSVAKKAVIEFVRLLRTAATYNGHVTPSRTWYLYYETDNFQQELEEVLWEIMPLYRELHAYLRYSLRQTYGTRVAKSDGCLPASVMEQAIHQAWLPQTMFRLPYPKSALPQVQRRLEEVMVTPMKLSRKAAEFFESLGLNQMSENFYQKYARRINDEEVGSDCKAEVFYFPPAAGIRYCPKLDYKKLMQMHGYLAEFQYNLYKKDLPIGADREPCPGFGTAIGEAAVIASGTPRHLHKLHILYNESLTEEQSINRLFRMGVHTIMSIPQYFVNEKFITDIIDGRIEAHDINCGYWKLQNKYAGVIPPIRRNEKFFDPDYKFYRGLNPEKSNTVKFLSEVLGMQFYRQLCFTSGQYKPGDPKFPLNNCDFYGNKKAGDIIKSMMELGATKHWRDVLEIGTGERKLSGKGIMEYFAPLFTWLKEENRRLQNEKGWDDETQCKSGEQ